MTIRIGNAPCSWGVEFADSPSNPAYETVLLECSQAGYKGIELGPVGYMPQDPEVLGEALAKYDLELIGGVVYSPFHDADAWEKVLDTTHRTCKALASHGAEHLVLIDSISKRRASTAGRYDEAEKLDTSQWTKLVSRIAQAARIGSEEYGLTVGFHAHTGGFVEFEPELERLLDEVDESILKICFDTGHHTYAGYDAVKFIQRHIDRISYLHFKDIDAHIKTNAINNRTGFYAACGEGIFCNLGEGEVDFTQVRNELVEHGFNGWCTVEQDCDPTLDVHPMKDARANRQYLESIGF